LNFLLSSCISSVPSFVHTLFSLSLYSSST
jgi:hypothetical protein